MLIQRKQLRLPAVVVTGLLLLTGVGEAAGFGVCIHHGTAHHHDAHDRHGPEISGAGSTRDHSMRDQGSLAHGHAHDHSARDAEPGEQAGAPDAARSPQTPIPAVSGIDHQPSPDHDDACRVLCAAVGTVTPAPPEARPATDLYEVGQPVVSLPLVATAVLKPTNRPHFLPPSQGPPVQA